MGGAVECRSCVGEPDGSGDLVECVCDAALGAEVFVPGLGVVGVGDVFDGLLDVTPDRLDVVVGHGGVDAVERLEDVLLVPAAGWAVLGEMAGAGVVLVKVVDVGLERVVVATGTDGEGLTATVVQVAAGDDFAWDLPDDVAEDVFDAVCDDRPDDATDDFL